VADDTLDSFARKIDRLADDLAGRAMRAQLDAVGVGAKKDASASLRSDIGDESMSNWPRRGRTQQLRVGYTVRGDTSLVVHPAGRASAGGWRILESGRNAAEGPRMVGPRLLKSGKVSRARQKRWSGRSDGKLTWSEAVEVMERNTPGRVNDAVGDLIGKHLRKF